MLTETQRIAAKIELQGYIDAVEEALSALAIQLHKLPESNFWRANTTGYIHSPFETKKYIIQAFKNIYYDDEQEPVESTAYIGAVRVPASLAPQVKTINDAKDAFEVCFTQLNKQLFTEADGRLLNGGRAALQNTIYARIHAHQTARHIPFVAEQPLCLSYTYLDTPTPVKVTRKRALSLVSQKTPDSFKDAAYLRLKGIDEDEVLVWRKRVPPRPRVNIQQQDGTWKQQAAVLPILYVDQGAETEMRFKNAKATPGRGRSLVKLEEEPLVMVPPIHRYKEAHRIFVNESE